MTLGFMVRLRCECQDECDSRSGSYGECRSVMVRMSVSIQARIRVRAGARLSVGVGVSVRVSLGVRVSVKPWFLLCVMNLHSQCVYFALRN